MEGARSGGVIGLGEVGSVVLKQNGSLKCVSPGGS